MVANILLHLRRIFVVLALLGATALLTVMFSIWSFATVHDPSPADAAIVLGATVQNDQPSPVFAERIAHAFVLYHSGQVRILIFTGGQGTDETMAEARVAQQEALNHHVPTEAILIETRAQTTYESLRAVQVLLSEHQLHRVLLVSDPLHMRRSITIARDLGLDAYPAPTPTSRYRTWRTQLPFLWDETRYLIGYLLRERLHVLTGWPNTAL